MGKLAINGGKKVVPDGAIKPWPHITEKDKRTVLAVLESGERIWGHGTKYLSLLEKEWAEYIGVKKCIATNSGTAALHMAVAGAGVEPGDEVITSAFTFVASATCILHHNAIPVFADVEPETFTIDPDDIERRINESTKAIIPVHIHGMPADMDRIMEIAKKHNLVVIEDAAQAHGAEYKGRKVGSIGHMGCFSMNTLKHLPAGEGGLFVSDNEKFYDRADLLRAFGEVLKPGMPREYNSRTLGWMYRTHELVAALAYSQLQRLNEYNKTRIENAHYLNRELGKVKGVIPTPEPEGRKSVYWLYAFRVPISQVGVKLSQKKWQDVVSRALSAEGVPVSLWQRMPTPAQSIFQTKSAYGRGCPWKCAKSEIQYSLDSYPNAARLVDEYLVIEDGKDNRYWDCIHYPNDLKLMSYFVEAFRKVFDNIDELVYFAEKEVKK